MKPYEIDRERLLLRVRLTPSARSETIGGVWRDENGTAHLRASVRAVPEKGRANKALVGLLARALGCPKSDIELIAGETSRLKRLALPDSVAGALAALAAEQG
ncbi:MAG: DUF167 domain-containing protein [Nitratireductor sp.]|nr:DUF167 domain-containing protein [Nitratireductor sp.]